MKYCAQHSICAIAGARCWNQYLTSFQYTNLVQLVWTCYTQWWLYRTLLSPATDAYSHVVRKARIKGRKWIDMRVHLMKLFIGFVLLTACASTTGQTPPAVKRSWVYTESSFTDAGGRAVTIRNSLPRGGGQYHHSSGKMFSYVIFWYRVVNESDVQLDLNISFPDSLAIFSAHAYFKIFQPPGTMTIEKDTVFNFGVTGLDDYLDTAFYKPFRLHKTIGPREEYLFYIGWLIYQASGSARSELVLKEHELFYKLNFGSEGALVPCGRIVYKN